MQMQKICCVYCGEEFNPDEDDINPSGLGYWCGCCDYYNYFDASQDTRKFTLILEGNDEVNEAPVSLHKIRLNKRLSPLRYPGGKSKIADYILQFIAPGKTDRLISPYAGGASVELAFLQAGVFKSLQLNDYDFGVYSLFELIKTFPDALQLEIRNHRPTHDDFIRARQKIKNDYEGCDLFEAAWSLLLVNRLAYSGIYKANPLGGIRGDKKTMLSRWNPDDLCKRINTIHSMSDRYTVHNQDALEFIGEAFWFDKSTIFIDPPYCAAGEKLYRHYYTEDDHYALQLLLEGLHKETPCADLLVTYDDAPLINRIYEYPDIKRIKRKYSA
ncbi:DNA adenine methylase [Paenibacillus polymyxa]|uniref:DNA adenine methylase n=1 Tax=Paenibacillus polymyxa TaxID=1406 RepID=UPI0025B62C8F|nr:DNA adenine methylase [Paenibacillus polymyxa]MDN4090974.1 DNA adenine methylase [Paenibacillus polymyxa]